jgi:hypothetical protein
LPCWYQAARGGTLIAMFGNNLQGLVSDDDQYLIKAIESGNLVVAPIKLDVTPPGRNEQCVCEPLTHTKYKHCCGSHRARRRPTRPAQRDRCQHEVDSNQGIRCDATQPPGGYQTICRPHSRSVKIVCTVQYARSRRSDRPGTRRQRCSAWAFGSDPSLPPANTEAQDALSVEGPAPRPPLYRPGVVRGSRPVKAARRSQSSAPGAGQTSAPKGAPGPAMLRY